MGNPDGMETYRDTIFKLVYESPTGHLHAEAMSARIRGSARSRSKARQDHGYGVH